MKNCRAYTLFEVILSLVLLLAILMIIGVAIDSHLNNLAISRMQIEEAQMARALLQKVAGDIRAVMLDPEVETQTTSSATTSTDTTSTENSDGGETADSSSTGTQTETTSDTTSTSDDTYDFEHEIIGTKKGLYGGLDWLQIDTHRTIVGERFAAQPDEYLINEETEEPPALDSSNCGQKTVLYYLGYDTGTPDADEEFQRHKQGSTVAPVPFDQQGLLQSPIKYGLYYREMNRQITQYAVEAALESVTDMSARDEQLASEVDHIEFHYYVKIESETGTTSESTATTSGSTTSESTSGTTTNRTVSNVTTAAGEDGEWVDEWDMDTEGGQLPLAVQIIVSIRRKDYKPTMIRSLLSSEDETKRVVTYSLIVPLSVELIEASQSETESTSSTGG